MSLTQLKQSLAHKGLDHLNLQWEAVCLEYLRSTSPNDLEEAFLNQFKSSNLRDSNQSSLPQDIHALHNITLFTRPTILQLVNLDCISQSTFSHLERIRESRIASQKRIVQVKDSEQEPSVGFARGTLLLELSDGFVNVKGLEMNAIVGLDISVPLGIKVYLWSK